jgi:hypothetical protein
MQQHECECACACVGPSITHHHLITNTLPLFLSLTPFHIPTHHTITPHTHTPQPEWWVPLEGVTWRNPEGPKLPDVFTSERGNHPVVQVRTDE